MSYNGEQLLEYLKKYPLLLAPMAGVTDYPFRSFMREMNGGILTTELVSAIALVREPDHRTYKIALIDPEQQPTGIQIFGEDSDILAQAALKVEEMGASFVDLNLGCPVTKIVKKGAGSALLKDLSQLSKILKAIKSKIKIPLTLKVRTGWDHQRNALEVSRIAYNEGCLWMTIHGRTRSQGYSGKADWDYIADVKSKAPLPIIGNGDLVSPQNICRIYKETQCSALMIGRGALKNPWIFNDTYKLLGRECPNDSYPKNAKEVLEVLFGYLSDFHNERMALLQFKKFAVWFSSGYPESSLFRKSIFQIKEKSLVLNYAFNYFEQLNASTKESMPYESFLMHGHG